MKETSDMLRAVAAQWLRYEQACFVVALERGPVRWWGRPDVIGITLQKTVVEVEIKVTLADFRNNEKKRCMELRQRGVAEPPQRFYFLVPSGLVDRCEHLLPTDAGLITCAGSRNPYSGLPTVHIVRKADFRKDSRKLTWQEIATMVKHQSGTVVSLLTKINRLQQPNTTYANDKMFSARTNRQSAPRSPKVRKIVRRLRRGCLLRPVGLS